MRSLRSLGPYLGVLAGVLFLAAWPAASQFQFQMPTPRGVFNPVVGTGAAYELINGKGEKNDMEISIVGKEDAAGKPGYWMEVGMNNPRSGQMYIKELMAYDGTTMTITRMVMQMGSQQPMEMTGMMNAARPGGPGPGGQQPPAADYRKEAVMVGTESVTTPAGTFSCQHYKANDGNGEVWITTNVSPWGLVKSVEKNGTSMTLTRTFTNATDHITGTPRQFQMPNLPGGAGGGGYPPPQSR